MANPLTLTAQTCSITTDSYGSTKPPGNYDVDKPREYGSDTYGGGTKPPGSYDNKPPGSYDNKPPNTYGSDYPSSYGSGTTDSYGDGTKPPGSYGDKLPTYDADKPSGRPSTSMWTFARGGNRAQLGNIGCAVRPRIR